jgi:hypothetical protein
MRSLPIVILVLCLFLGAYLLINAPPFFVVNRFDPSQGVWLSSGSSRVLGIGLLVVAWGGVRFIRQVFYVRKTPDWAWQRMHFVLTLLGLALMVTALYSGEVGTNPDFIP